MKFLYEFLGDFSMSGTRRMQGPGNIRAGNLTKGVRSSIFDLKEEDETPQAAILIVRDKSGKFLAVSRGDDVTDMNLPGGKIELGEEPAQAAARELWEETGLKVHQMHPVYTGPGNNGKFVAVYRVTACSGKLRSSDEGYVDWVTPNELLNSTYGGFFRRMAKKLNIELF